MIVARFATTKNPTYEDLDEGDHVHEDHDGHCSASGSEDGLVRFCLVPQYKLFVTRGALRSLRCRSASSLIGLYDLVLVSLVSPFCGRSDAIHFAFAILSTSSMSDCVSPCSCMRIRYSSSSMSRATILP